MTDRTRQFTVVLERELRSLSRTRSAWLLAAGFVVLVTGTTLLSGTGGYVQLSLALLTPIELLVPVFAAAIGYRSILADRERDELTVLRTYPIDADTYAWGVYCGRLIGFLCIVVGSLLLVGILVPIISPSPSGLTRIAGLDSPLYYARFVVLSALFAAVVLAVMILLSAVAKNARRGIITAVIAVVVVGVGLDLALVLGLAGDLVSSNSLPWYLALSPTSAYRGLVMTYVVSPVATSVVRPAVPLANVVGLCCWLLASILLAGRVTWGPLTFDRE